MREYEQSRFYCRCPRCGALPGERCVTLDVYEDRRSNHPERNRLWRERKATALTSKRS